MNRGSPTRFSALASSLVASMRPRFMNRGSFSRLGSQDSLSCASMRPRFMNRGSQFLIAFTGMKVICFNEAPIHESGK